MQNAYANSRSRGAHALPPKTTLKSSGRRSSGWTPLVFPASALMQDSGIPENGPQTANPYFPLHRDVLRAAVRELLILNGQVDGCTLKVNSLVFSANPGSRKRTLNDSKEHASRKIGKERVPEQSIDKAEELVDTIVRHALILPEQSHCTSSSSPLMAVPMPRKVSDADNLPVGDVSGYRLHPVDLLDRYESSTEVSRFLDLNARAEDGSFVTRRNHMAPMLEVSIASESLLKVSCFKMTSQLLESFDEKPLRLFFGYKSSALKTDRLQRLFADFLFDASHAMFGWVQTEREMLSELGAKAATQNLDTAIRDILFNERALRKIGGFDDSSLLRHSISIHRLSGSNLSWENFATTKEGKRLLHHHLSGNTLSAGQQRRGQRVRRAPTGSISDNSSDEEERRSRASSVASVDEVTSSRTALTDKGVSVVEHVTQSQGAGVESVTLRKAPGSSWGILLSKEGQLCVVVRSPDERQGLRSGDIIMSVRNNIGVAVYPQSEEGSDWFCCIVDVFKTCDVLYLGVRRVVGQVAAAS